MKTKIALLAITCLAASPAWAINKCTGADGKVVFQDAPCAGKGEALNIRPSSGASRPATAEAATDAKAKRDAEIAGINRRSEVRAAIQRGEPLVGMSRAELDQALGAPSKVNADNYSGVLKDQIIYDRPGQSWYVYTENGVVTSIQHRPSELQQTAVRCPSGLEIRAMETSASSITLSERERVQRRREIADARRCGKY